MLPYSEPKIDESIGRLTYLWPDLALKVVADRITDAGTAELWFYNNNGTGDTLLHTTKANLLSTSTMAGIAKRMKSHSEDVPWIPVLTCISAKTMEYSRRGEPGVVIEPSESEAVHPGYYIEPVIMKGVPNIIYGDKGVNKTTSCLTMLGIIALGSDDSSTGLISLNSAKVAMLDWQANKELTSYTVSRLVLGDTITWFALPYLRCKQPLADDIDRIANFLHDNQTQVVLIDSLGQAAGSDKFDTSGKGAALKFFEALRQLNLTSLIIAENAKGEETGRKTIFGSTYFTYYARNIFELRGKQDEMNENEMHIALFHQESNYSKKYQPLGFNLTYTDSTIKIASEPVSLSAFLERASQMKALLEFLSEGAKTRQSVSQKLGVSLKHAGVLLNRAKNRELVISLGSGMWGLISKHLDEDNGKG